MVSYWTKVEDAGQENVALLLLSLSIQIKVKAGLKQQPFDHQGWAHEADRPTLYEMPFNARLLQRKRDSFNAFQDISY